MPGSFSDSPEQQLTKPDIWNQNPSTLFNNISRSLGFKNATPPPQIQPQHQQVKKMLTDGHDEGGSSSELPPAYTQKPRPSPSAPAPGDGKVSSPQDLQQNLQSAIKASRSYTANSLFSRPETNEIKESPSYCDSRPGHDLTFVRDLDQGMKFFLSRHTADSQTFYADHQRAIASFATLLVNCATIFDLPVSTVNIFADQQGSTIAFNRNGSIFCNLRYFEQLHAGSMDSSDGSMEAMAYWWITLCHELAHNLVGDHGPQHSYYSESFAHQYFPRMVWWATHRTDIAAR